MTVEQSEQLAARMFAAMRVIGFPKLRFLRWWFPR
jgi:hypothetical protein